MIGKVDKRTAQALVSLNTFSDWSIIKEWLTKSVKESLYRRMIGETDQAILHQYQGALLLLEDLLEKQIQAQKIFENFK